MWSWDETLYGGSAAYYPRGRFPYPPELADALRDELGLDGTGLLLDVGCGPAPLTLQLAPLFERAVGIDADPDMIDEAQRQAARRRVENTEFRKLRAEALPAGLGAVRVATFAQSFHWMDQPRVASLVREMLEPEGAWVHVHATTHQGVGDAAGLPAPAPPHDRIAELIQAYLGPVRRAGQGTRAERPAGGEEAVMVAAGFGGPRRLEVGGGHVHDRSEDDVVASVYSRSSSAPHLFEARLAEFEADLRGLLRRAAPDGRFSERARAVELVIWRR